jgi:hypothetical protein
MEDAFESLETAGNRRGLVQPGNSIDGLDDRSVIALRATPLLLGHPHFGNHIRPCDSNVAGCELDGGAVKGPKDLADSRRRRDLFQHPFHSFLELVAELSDLTKLLDTVSSTNAQHIPRFSGGIDAYEFYVWLVLYFCCDGCGASLECPVTEQDHDAPGGAWMRHHAQRAHSLGWYVHPLSAAGGLIATAFCPACSEARGLTVQ